MGIFKYEIPIDYTDESQNIYHNWEVLEYKSVKTGIKTVLYAKCLCINCGVHIQEINKYQLIHYGKECELCKEIELNSLIDKEFNRLTVISRVNYDKSPYLYNCQCECGKEIIVDRKKLLSGNTSSCGCYKTDSTVKRSTTHGLSNHRLYGIYYDILKRCYNEKRSDYERYGGRGIYVCEEWLDKENGFMNFYNWSINNGYSDELSIDRIDVDGNYCPENCKWSTDIEQSRNKRNTLYVNIYGVKISLRELSEKFDINYDKLKYNYHKGIEFVYELINNKLETLYNNTKIMKYKNN